MQRLKPRSLAVKFLTHVLTHSLTSTNFVKVGSRRLPCGDVHCPYTVLSLTQRACEAEGTAALCG